MTSTPDQPHLSPLSTGLRGRCPHCGGASMYKGFLTLQSRCPACGLDYDFADPADGPAFFAMSGVGILAMAGFMAFEFTVQPPVWVHFVVTFPLIALACVGVLRPIKGWMVAEQHVRKAEEAVYRPQASKAEGAKKDDGTDSGAG